MKLGETFQADVKLLKDHFLPEYIIGYEQFKRQNKINTDNIYFQLLQLAKVSHVCRYNYMSDKEMIAACVEKFDIIDNIKREGYKQEFPVFMLKNKYQNVWRFEDQNYGYFDGHHRLTAANYLGITTVPAQLNKTPVGPVNIQLLKRLEIKNNWKWYQPINFGVEQNEIDFFFPLNECHSYGKFEFILKRNLEPIAGKRFLELGCNTGVLCACIAENYAEYVIGVDYNKIIEQARTIYYMLWVDYGNMSFIGLDILDTCSFKKQFLGQHFDCILMSNFLYYMGNRADEVIDICKSLANKIVIQGNHMKCDANGKFVSRLDTQPNYRGEYTSIEGMCDILKRHGFKVIVDAPENYPKPVVIGRC